MENFVNKIKTKDGTEYNMNDERVPQILEESKGKFLKVNDEGNLEFADVPAGGGTKLYKHAIQLTLPAPLYSDNVVVISNIATPLNELDSSGIRNLLASACRNNQKDQNTYRYLIHFGGATPYVQLVKCTLNGDSNILTPTAITDTVTEL